MTAPLPKLRKLGPGQYVTLDGRYQVERQDGTTECDHPQCDVLHRKWHSNLPGRSYGWVHYVPYPAWHVWDNEHDDYAGGHGPEEYETKRDAVQALASLLAKEEKHDE